MAIEQTDWVFRNRNDGMLMTAFGSRGTLPVKFKTEQEAREHLASYSAEYLERWPWEPVQVKDLSTIYFD
jgi:hypothetical protein